MPSKERMTEADLKAYSEKMREKARPVFVQDALQRAFEAGAKAALGVLLTLDGEEKWALEKELGKPVSAFFEAGAYMNRGEQKLWLKTEPKAKGAKKAKK